MFNRSSLDEPIPKHLIILYLTFIGVSIWATGESLARSFDYPRIITYLIGLAFSGGASFGLSLIKRGNGRPVNILHIIVGSLMFFVLWSASLISNTHNLYLVSSIEDIRKEELSSVRNKLNLLEEKSISNFNRAEDEFVKKTEALVKAMVEQINNDGNMGLGSKADKEIIAIEQLLETSVTRLDPVSRTTRGIRDLANNMASQIRGLLRTKIELVGQNRAQLTNYLDEHSSEINSDIDKVDDVYDNYESRDDQSIINTIRSTYSHYNRHFDFINGLFSIPFLKENVEFDFEKLPELPESIQIENIGNSWRFIKSKNKYTQDRFWIALFFAIVVDFAAFGILYFGILSHDE